MARPKGQQKLGGRKKGTPNKKTDMRNRLLAHGCDVDLAISEAIFSKDYEMIRVLTPLLAYLQPKFKDIEAPKEDHSESQTIKAPTTHLLDIVK